MSEALSEEEYESLHRALSSEHPFVRTAFQVERIVASREAAAATRARAEALREVNAILAETEWYCDDDHDWRGKVLLIRRLRAALTSDTAGDS